MNNANQQYLDAANAIPAGFTGAVPFIDCDFLRAVPVNVDGWPGPMTVVSFEAPVGGETQIGHVIVKGEPNDVAREILAEIMEYRPIVFWRALHGERHSEDGRELMVGHWHPLHGPSPQPEAA